MLRSSFVVAALLAILALVASAQELTARSYARVRGVQGPNASAAIVLGPPHACGVSKQHPCIYYGGDIDPSDPQEDALSNENSVFIPRSFTYTEINVPVSINISAAFSNNLQTYGVIDPQTATWNVRIGVSEGNGGTLIAYGDSPAQLTNTGRNAFGLEEYELITRTPITLPAGNVWFGVTPDCTDENNPDCNGGRYFESDTDGLNGLNTRFTVTSNDGFGPLFGPENFFGGFYNWCNDEGLACGDGLSAGFLK